MQVRSQRDNLQGRFDPDSSKLTAILDGNAEELINYADKVARYFASGDKQKLSTSQIRNVLDELHKIKSYDPTKLQLLRAKLAYAAGRHRGRVEDFQRLIDLAIQMVKSEAQFKCFKNFVEAIVAYHRLHGGK
jgi:CRISPR-associated protein Csm2